MVLLEANDVAGGVARTIEREGYRLEPGVGSMPLPGRHLGRILDHAGVATTPAPAARKRYLLGAAGLEPVGPSPALVTSRLLSPRGKLAALREPFVAPQRDGEESLTMFLRRRFGDEAGSLLADVMAAGVFAGDPDRLSATASFPRLVEFEDVGGSIVRGGVQMGRLAGNRRSTTHVPIGGMAAMVDRLVAALGDRARLGRRVEGVSRSDDGWVVDAGERHHARHVVLAVSPEILSGFVGIDAGGAPPRAAVDVVWLGWPRSGVELPAGFGYIATRDAGHASLGCLFESSLSPDASPAGIELVKAIVGGARRPDVLEMAPDDVTALVSAEVSEALGRPLDVTFAHVVRHRPGIPQYEMGHSSWLASLEGQLPEGIHAAGWSYRAIGVTRLAEDAARIADRIVA